MRPLKIAVLMTCHNRRELTLRCLEHLSAQGNAPDSPSDEESNLNTRHSDLTAFLVDDGSTDGTTEMVKSRFPEVRIISGDGSLFWCGGTRRAWNEAAKEDFDAYLWLNDDTLLRPGALNTLVEVAENSTDTIGENESRDHLLPPVVVVGSTCDPESGLPTYGERGPHDVLPPPLERARLVKWSINGNLVLISAAAYRTIGNLEEAYRHKFGDVDYGIRAQKAGITVFAAPGFLAECRANGPADWEQAAKPLRARWRALTGPKGISAREMKHFMSVQGRGLWWLSMLKLYWKTIFPPRKRPEDQKI